MALRVKEYGPVCFCLFLQEEQNASSSANYDVELLHPLEAHDEILLTGKWEQCNICIM